MFREHKFTIIARIKSYYSFAKLTVLAPCRLNTTPSNGMSSRQSKHRLETPDILDKVMSIYIARGHLRTY